MAVSKTYSDLCSSLERMEEAFKDPRCKSLSPLLMMLQAEGKPFTLTDHYMLEPLFKRVRPKRRILKTARQVGKSFGISATNNVTSMVIPGYRSLFVCPRFEQVKKLNTDVLRPMIEHSPFRDCFFDKDSVKSILQRVMTNQSTQYFSYAYLDAERIRGISGIHEVFIDEVQDINDAFIPVIGEVMSAVVKYGFYTFSGTPLSLDNTIEFHWQKSSQAEWVVPCSCKKYNIGSVDEDLLKMIGKTTCVCAKCGKPLDCRAGFYVHRYPERANSYEGFHISQVVHPRHYEYPHKWKDLLYKMSSDSGYTEAQFHNEVLGESKDSAKRLLTAADLQKVSTGNINTLPEAIKALQPAYCKVIGVDWGGGGEDVSYTSIAVGGLFHGSDKVRCVYGTKLDPKLADFEQVKFVLDLFIAFRADFLAHDYNTFGALYEVLLTKCGFPQEKVVPFGYVFSPNKALVTFNQGSHGNRSCYSLDKPRSLSLLCTTVRSEKIILPEWGSQVLPPMFGDKYKVSSDLLSLYTEITERPRGGKFHVIKRAAGRPDDFANALNYMTCALWYTQGSFPDIADNPNMRLSKEDLALLNPSDPDWN